MSVVDEIPAFSNGSIDISDMYAIRVYAAAALTGFLSGVPVGDDMARDPGTRATLQDVARLCIMAANEMVKAERESCTRP